MRSLALGVAIAIATAACSQGPASTPDRSPTSNQVQADWSRTSLHLDGVGFDCSRATDSPDELRATAGAGATHSQALGQCAVRIRSASVDLQVYDRALVNARDLPLTNRERLHALAGELASLLAKAQAAAAADDPRALSSARNDIAAVEGQMLAAGA